MVLVLQASEQIPNTADATCGAILLRFDPSEGELRRRIIADLEESLVPKVARLLAASVPPSVCRSE
jgi:hypothetical protein